MRLTSTLEHLGIPRFHHKGRNSVVLIDAPREHNHDASRTGPERWRASSYRDPWPDRA